MCKLYFVKTLNNFNVEFQSVYVSNRTTKKFYGFNISYKLRLYKRIRQKYDIIKTYMLIIN